MLRKAEEALQTTKRVMNPWEIWLWPWIAGSALTRRALETGHGSMEASNGDAELPRVSEPEWASPNHVTIELDAMRVRDFSAARDKRRSTLIVAPFALHDARIADLSSGHDWTLNQLDFRLPRTRGDGPLYDGLQGNLDGAPPHTR